MVRCAVATCSSDTDDKVPGRRFFRFPKNGKNRSKLWVKACGRPELLDKTLIQLNRQNVMCDLHFQPSDRLPYHLKKIAVPTLNLVPFKNNNPEQCTQTDFLLDVKEEQEWTSKSNKRKLPIDHQDVIKKCKTSTNTSASVSTNASLSASVDTSVSVSENMNTSTKNSVSFVQLIKLIYFQRKLKTQHKRGTEKYNLFALKVCTTIPHAYRVIRDILDLPSAKQLYKDYIDIDTKLTTNALACLEMKIKSMKRSEKYCVVYAEKIDVRFNLYYQINKDKIIGFHDVNGVQTPELATHAIVIVARGIFSDWEQPLTYCFLSKGKHEKELNVWLNDTLSKVMTIGLKVTAFISGHEQIFTDVAKMWDVTVAKPYFFVNRNKVYYLFDFFKLVKSLRDKLMENDFLYHDAEGNVLTVTWEDVKTIYAIDSQRQYPIAPELTEIHINPSQAEKMVTEFATQVFSKPVEAAMTFAKELGQLEEKSAGTIKFIEMVSETIEILNSSLDLTVSAAKSNQIDTIKQLILFLKDVTVLERDTYNDISKTIKCLKGLKVTLKNIVDLSQDLKLRGFKILHTNKICENILQKFICKIKICQKPTPVKLSKAFKKYFMDNILKYSKNADSGLDKLLSMDVDSGPECFQEKVVRSLLIGTLDYRFDVPEEHSLIYVCGYLMRKCHNIHKCLELNKYLHNTCHINAPYYEALITDTSIMLPPPEFVHLVEQMDKIFIRHFQKKQMHSIGNEIKAEIGPITMDICCPEFPFEYLIKLFIRFRILNVIRSNNINFVDSSFKWKCFSLYNI